MWGEWCLGPTHMVLGKRMGTPQNPPTRYTPLYKLIIVGLDILGEVYGVVWGTKSDLSSTGVFTTQDVSSLITLHHCVV